MDLSAGVKKVEVMLTKEQLYRLKQQEKGRKQIGLWVNMSEEFAIKALLEKMRATGFVA